MKPSTLTLGTKKMRGPRLGADSRFPAMRNPIGSNIAAELDEFDGLYLNYGMFNDSLPFVMQDQYDSEPPFWKTTTCGLPSFWNWVCASGVCTTKIANATYC